MLENEKYTGTVTLLDSATQEYEYQMKECHPPIITESEFRTVQEEKKNATPLVDWLKVQANAENVKYLPCDVSYDLSSFEEFMEKRQKLMSDKLKEIML